MYIDVRSHQNYPSKHKRKRPISFKLGTFDRIKPNTWPDMNEAQFRFIDSPASDHPHAIILPLLPPAGILHGRPDRQGLYVTGVVCKILRSETGINNMGSGFDVPKEQPNMTALYLRDKTWLMVTTDADRVGRVPVITQLFDPEAFARMVLKIAHSFSIAALQMPFRAYLPEYILGRKKDFSSVMGSSSNPPDRRSRNRVAISLALNGPLVMAQVQLFANHEFRSYTVVVGEVVGRRTWFV